jgi:hypothetical protein
MSSSRRCLVLPACDVRTLPKLHSVSLQDGTVSDAASQSVSQSVPGSQSVSWPAAIVQSAFRPADPIYRLACDHTPMMTKTLAGIKHDYGSV